MDTFLAIFIIFSVTLIIVGIAAGSASSAKKHRAEREKDQKHEWNTAYLYQLGFRIEEFYHPEKSPIHLYYDYTNRNVALEYYVPKLVCSELTFFPLDKIVECDLIQDGTVVSREEGKLGGAVLWGFGGMTGTKEAYTDSMVGVLAVRLLIDDMRVSSVTINVLESSISKTSPAYQTCFIIAQEVYGKFQGIVRINKAERQRIAQESAPKPAQLPESILNQVRQLAQLKDDGILTDQEFETKKKLLMEKIN